MLRKQVLALGAVLGIVCSPISANAVEWTLGLGAGVAPDYQGSENYELVPRLSTFNADEGFKDVALDASLTYRFVGNWSATGTLKYTRLLGDAADSPLTDDNGDANQLFGGLLINYTF